MDVKMPKMDGITAAEKILQELSCAVVMLTAFSQTELVERARDAGAMAYVVKPFSPADLIPAVEIALSRHAEIESLEDQIADLSDRFETRKRVDRAKGLLMKNMGMSEPEAFRSDSEDVDGSSSVHARGCRRGDQPGRRLSHRCANGEGQLTLPIAVHSYSVVA